MGHPKDHEIDQKQLEICKDVLADLDRENEAHSALATAISIARRGLDEETKAQGRLALAERHAAGLETDLTEQRRQLESYEAYILQLEDAEPAHTRIQKLLAEKDRLSIILAQLRIGSDLPETGDHDWPEDLDKGPWHIATCPRCHSHYMAGVDRQTLCRLCETEREALDETHRKALLDEDMDYLDAAEAASRSALEQSYSDDL